MIITTRKKGSAMLHQRQKISYRLLLERLEDRLVPSVAEGTILVATLPSTFANGDVSGFPTAIVGVDPGTGAQAIVSSGKALALPTYIAEGPDQQLYVTDLKAFGTGAIIAIDPNTGNQRLVATGGLINGPNVLVYLNGFLYVADEGDASGVIHNLVRIDPNTGDQKLISDGSSGGFSVPVGMALAGGDNLYVADEPGNVQGSDPGKIWRVNLDTGQQTIVSDNNGHQGKLFNHPVDLAIDNNGNIVVVNTGSAANGYAGSVLRIDPQTGAQTLVSTFGYDTGLDSIEVGRDGTIFVGAIHVGATVGRIYSVNPVTGAQGILASGGSLSEVEGIRAFHVTATTTSRTTIVASASSSVSGQALTFTATVSGSSSGNPTGLVNFFDGATLLGQGSLSTTAGVSTASFSTATLSTAAHTIVAVYSGDTNFGPSSSSALTETVNKANTSAVVGFSANPAQAGQGVTLTATLAINSPGSAAVANPSGVVIFWDGATSIGQSAPTTSGGATTASFSSGFAPGSHAITASYGGDSNYSLATSAVLTLIVAQGNTSLSVTTSSNPSAVGQNITFTATILVTGPAAGTPTGTVQFQIDGSNVGGAVNMSGSGTAFFSTAALTVGPHTITAKYSGDGNFAGSNGSLPSAQVVASLGTTTTVVSSLNPSVSGQAVSFTATVNVQSQGSGTPKGSVQFQIDGNPVGSPITLSGGQATSGPITWLTAGGHKVTASYSGSQEFAASVGNLAGGQTVQTGATVATVSCSVAQSQLWPPNKKMVNVGLSVTVTPASASIDVQVYGNDDADEEDADGIAPGSLELRSERQGDGDGRVYLIVVTASNGGASSFDVCAVVVPHDNSDDSLEDVQQQATAAVSYYRKFQTAPDDFDLLGDSGGDGDAPPPSANPGKPAATADALSSALTGLQVPATSPGQLTSPSAPLGTAAIQSLAVSRATPMVDQFFASVKKEEAGHMKSGRKPMTEGEVRLGPPLFFPLTS